LENLKPNPVSETAPIIIPASAEVAKIGIPVRAAFSMAVINCSRLNLLDLSGNS